MLEKIAIEKLEQYVGQQIRIGGIVEKIEDHGGILFLQINDLSFLANAVVIPDKEIAFAMAKNLKEGYLIEVIGIVKKCPLSSQGPPYEIEVETLSIVSARTRMENMIKIVRKE
jgi:asparaginyl-tRNA synthetase